MRCADWGTAGLLEGLYVVKTDLVRLDSLLPELSPRDRGGELVEHSVRQHVSLCFAALERRLLGSAEALRGALQGPACRRNGEAKQQVLDATTDEAFSLAERRMRLLCGE